MQPPEAHTPLPAFGMSSLVLGFCASLIFFMPVLGTPVAVAGVCCGLIGLLFALCSRAYSLRWALGGLALSLLALGVNLALYFAPEGYLMRPRTPSTWPPPPDRPYVAPPA